MELTSEETELIKARRQATADQKQADLDAAGVFDIDNIKPGMSKADRDRAKAAIASHWS